MKILIALDSSSPSRRAVAYVAGLTPHLADGEFVLLALAPSIPEGSAAFSPTAPSPELHGDEDHREELTTLQDALGEATDLLQAAGVPAGRITRQLRPVSLSVSDDIVEAAVAAGCDTVVVGRRGLSRVKELVLGSVSNDVVHKATSLTVWVVA